MYKISRDKFIEVIKENKKDYEKFCEFKDNLIMGNDTNNKNSILSLLKVSKNISAADIISCLSCKECDHLTHDCPKTHLILNSQSVIGKHNKSEL